MNTINRLHKYQKTLKERKTNAEMIFEQILISLGLRFKSQKCFQLENINSIADYYLERPLRIVFEIDGKQHLDGIILIRDIKKELLISKRDIQVFRIMNEDLYLHKDEVIKDILQIIKNRIIQKKLYGYIYIRKMFKGQSVEEKQKRYDYIIGEQGFNSR